MVSLKAARESLGLTQQVLAASVGVDQTEISKLEQGIRQMTVRLAVRLSEPLGIDPIDLLEFEVEMEFKRRALLGLI